MAERVASLVIDRPVEDVWNYMTDISNLPRWEDSGAVWKQMSEGPIQVGTPIQSSITKLGRTVTFDLRVTEFEPYRTFSVEALAGRARGTSVRYVLTPVTDQQTRLSRETVAQFHGILILLQPLAASITKRTGALEVRNVKRIMESQP